MTVDFISLYDTILRLDEENGQEIAREHVAEHFRLHPETSEKLSQMVALAESLRVHAPVNRWSPHLVS